MNTPREAAFDNIVFAAAQLLRVRTAMFALVDDERVWCKAAVGPRVDLSRYHETLIGAVVEANEVVSFDDASANQRVGMIRQGGDEVAVRFFAGAPLIGPNRQVIGVLCGMDAVPRTLSARGRWQLGLLAEQGSELLRLRVPGLDVSD